MGRPVLIGPLTASETKKKQKRREWYQRNKNLTKQRAADAKIRTQNWFKEEKKRYQCSHCGSKNFDKLGFYDLNHIYPPSLTKPGRMDQVSELVGRRSRKEIKEAMATRTCLCGDCWHTHYRHY